MQRIMLEHSKFAYYMDFVFYGFVVVFLAVYLVAIGPKALYRMMLICSLFGLLMWSPIEYFLHRFVLHGLAPFKDWHAEHHHRPTALICMPVFVSTSLILLFVFLPAWMTTNFWLAVAFTLGLLIGYFLYGVIHHALHHCSFNFFWFKRLQYWHALHHSKREARSSRYGVTSRYLDYLFSTYK